MESVIDLVTMLKKKKVKVIEIPKWGTYLRKQWEDNFANHLSDKEKKSIYLYDEDGCCGYLCMYLVMKEGNVQRKNKLI